VEVTLVDANHCPGAAQLLFALPGGRRYVHVGDFRFHARMLADARLAAFRRADALYLDTTYCKPAHCFPLQARGRPRAPAPAPPLLRCPGAAPPARPAPRSPCMRAPARRARARRAAPAPSPARPRKRGQSRLAGGPGMCALPARAPGSVRFDAPFDAWRVGRRACRRMRWSTSRPRCTGS